MRIYLNCSILLQSLRNGVTMHKHKMGVFNMSVVPLLDKRAYLRDELDEVLAAMNRLRADADQVLAADHPCAREIEDFWWRTKRFTEALSQKLGPA